MDKFIRKINTSPLIRKRITAGDNNIQPFPKTFGVPLKKVLEREDYSKVPSIVTSICEFLILYGLETEGLFRVNGNTKAVESIKCLFEENYAPDMSNCTDVFAVASVLKLFLREIPDGLITETHTNHLYEICHDNINNLEDCINDIRIILQSLPIENYNLLKYICKFLVQVVEKNSLNKMDCKNLGIVFGPNIFRMNQSIEAFKMQNILNSIFTYFISDYEIVFIANYLQHELSSGYQMDTQLGTQSVSNDGHKSSPSLSGDFDLSSSNDNHICPLPLPSVSSDLQKVISTCVNSHLSVNTGSDDPSLADYQKDVDLNAYQPSLMDDMLPEWQTQTNMIDLDDIDTMMLACGSGNNTSQGSSSKMSNNAVCTNSINASVYLDNDDNNQTITSNIGTFSTTNEFSKKDKKEPYYHHGRSHKVYQPPQPNVSPSNYRCKTPDINDRITYLKGKIGEFEENFERQHGCKPQIERTGNPQVQEWLSELMCLKEEKAMANIVSQNSLKKPLNNPKDSSFSSNSDRKSTNNPISSISKPMTNSVNSVTLGASSCTSIFGELDSNVPIARSSTTSGMMDDDSLIIRSKINSQQSQQHGEPNMSVLKFYEYLNEALKSQRMKSGRTEILQDMSKQECEDEKVDLQKCLLHFEKVYGRPRDLHVKQIMKPLYDRYRNAKRYIKAYPTNNPPVTVQQSNNQTQKVYPIASGRTRVLSLNSKNESTDYLAQNNDMSKVTLRPNHNSSSASRQQQPSNQATMTQSMMLNDHQVNNNPNRFWRPNSTSAQSNNWRTNMYYEDQQKDSLVEPSNRQSIVASVMINTGAGNNNTTSNNSITVIPVSHKSMNKSPTVANKLLKTTPNIPASTTSTIPVSASNSLSYMSSTSGASGHTISAMNNSVSNNEIITMSTNPAHSVYSSKSFNTTTINDLIPFRSCTTMNPSDIKFEKEKLMIEKRRLQRLLKEFEHGLERITGRAVEKSDRDHMRPEYDRYKKIKCRLMVLEKEIESRSRLDAQ